MKAVSLDYSSQALRFARLSLLPAGVTIVFVLAFFLSAGQGLEGDSHIRGTKLVTHRQLALWSDKKWKEYKKRFGKNFKGVVIPPFVGMFETRTRRPSGTGSVSWRV